MNDRHDNKNMEFSWMHPNLEIIKTERYGNGVFAIGNIKKGEIVSVIGGHILSIDDENRILRSKTKVIDKWIEISDRFSIGPITEDEEKFTKHVNFNHSCNPNIGFNGQLFLVTMKDIIKGEELCFDYAMCMNSSDKSDTSFKMKCLCGSPNCRGEITEDDWKLPELQKKYDGYFQWYLQEKINKQKTSK